MFKKPKRGKTKILADVTTSTMYDDYILGAEGIYAVPKDVFVDICFRFNEGIINHVIHDGMEYHAPSRAGIFSVVRMNKLRFGNPSMRAIDWKESNRLGKFVYYTNTHTNDYVYAFRWNKRGCNYENKTMYRYVPLRNAKRALSVVLKDKNRKVEYYDI